MSGDRRVCRDGTGPLPDPELVEDRLVSRHQGSPENQAMAYRRGAEESLHTTGGRQC